MNRMPPTWILSLWLLLPCAVQAAPVYGWVDDKGVTHYTDTPPPGKRVKALDVRPSPLIGTTPDSVTADREHAGAAKKAADATPWEVTLVTPAPNSTLRDNTGNILFQGKVTPPPPSPFGVRLRLNGKAAPIVHNSLSFQVENLDRGAYQAQLELLAKDGTILAVSPPTTFYLHKASVNQAPKVGPRAN